MGENTLRKQNAENLDFLLQSENTSLQGWRKHESWEVIRVGEVGIIHDQQERKITFQGNAQKPPPYLEIPNLPKRARMSATPIQRTRDRNRETTYSGEYKEDAVQRMRRLGKKRRRRNNQSTPQTSPSSRYVTEKCIRCAIFKCCEHHAYEVKDIT